MTIEWPLLPDREFRLPTPEPWTPTRVVACVNVWNDLPALRETWPKWRPFVDRVIVLDGRYDTQQASQDGLREWVESQDGADYFHYPWSDQNAKRSFFFRLTGHGDLLFIVDADEQVSNPAALREPQPGDIGWVNLTNIIYRRIQKQPRLIRWVPDLEYRNRHHWIYAGDRLLSTHQYSGTGWRNYLTPLWLLNDRGLGRTTERNVQRNQIVAAQSRRELPTIALSKASDKTTFGREPLQVLQWCLYDPGLVAFRLHTAINTTTPNHSALIRDCKEGDNPYGGPTQFDATGRRYSQTMRELIESADVLHCHLNYNILDECQMRQWKRPEVVVIHHHGSMLRNARDWYAVKDRQFASLKLISNFDLLKWCEGGKWLPNPVPVGYYRALRRQYLLAHGGVEQTGEEWVAGASAPGKPFVIGHSPSKPEIKGTAILRDAVDLLVKEGYGVELELIHGVSLEESLKRKARCDAFFDSFWLGIQCSGVEAGAMGIPVIAGDPDVRDRYVKNIGRCPYIFADGVNDRECTDVLFEELRKLVVNEDYRTQWGKLTAEYVLQYHDEAAVALRYLDLLDEAVGWRSQLALFTPDGREQTGRVRRPLPPGGTLPPGFVDLASAVA